MPALDRLAARFRGRPFALVALNEDREGQAVAAPFLAGLKLANIALYTDPQGRVQRALKVRSLPTTVVFDAAGREVGRLALPADWSAPEAVALIEHFVNRAR
jgi:thiol-disulfide isomerase/thioredoxin